MKKFISFLVLIILVGCASDFYNGNRYVARAGVIEGRPVQKGYSNVSMEEARFKALEACAKHFDFWPSTVFTDLTKTPCKVVDEYINSNHPGNITELKKIAETKEKENHKLQLKIEQRKFENEYERYITQCEYIGFKRGTDKMGECVLKIKDTEIKIAQSNAQIASSKAQERSADSANTVNNVILLNEALKLMNPPRQNFNCQAKPFGIYTNIYCN